VAHPVKTIHANGLEFAYIEEGNGPLVLLLHGFPDSARTWEGVLPEIASSGFHAVAVFTRGYFPSDMASDGDYSMEVCAHDVLALIKAFGNDQAILVGHDWGASIAYAAAIRAPEMVSKLVTLSIPPARTIKPSLRMFYHSPHFLLFQFGFLSEWWVRRNNFHYIDYLYRYWSPSWKVPENQACEVKTDFARPGRLRAALRYYHFLLTDKFNRQRTKLYEEKISVPTLCLVGAEDLAIRSHVFDGFKDAFSGPVEFKLIENAGHFLHREQPELFSEILLYYIH
jgi:pimeloyl-ACP methyl ester carboxylesterase